ncbi:MAG TPA: TA system VapC family ribonuclease toxin [Terracidiphilus sp.]|nr:TA system VapC family ribonuclease toxin [Terracidiphilus sp.]
MKSLIFLDLNVWLALSYENHSNNEIAMAWFKKLDAATALIFCRHTQLGLLRLLSTQAVMKQDAMSEEQCWKVYDSWIESGVAFLAQEPPGLESAFRLRTKEKAPSAKQWADGYLAAFAEAAGLTLVTFDQALAGMVKGAVVLS